MKESGMTSKLGTSNIIHIDFRKERLFIDDDNYCSNVTEIHCRCCDNRKPRKGARELEQTWGYICEGCRRQSGSFEDPGVLHAGITALSERYCPAGRSTG